MQHIRDDEKTDHAPPYVDLIKLGDAAISASHCDIFQRNVEVILRYEERISVFFKVMKMDYLQQASPDIAVLS